MFPLLVSMSVLGTDCVFLFPFAMKYGVLGTDSLFMFPLEYIQTLLLDLLKLILHLHHQHLNIVIICL